MLTKRVPLALTAGAIILAASGCGQTGGATTAAAGAQPSGSATPAGSTAGTSASPQAHPTEFNPPGDIPDNQVYVSYQIPGSTAKIKVPEGWAQRPAAGGGSVFSDHFNSITVSAAPASSAPTPSSFKTSELPVLAKSAPQFALEKVSTVQRSSGPVLLATYLKDSKPDPVTGKVVREESLRFEFWRQGTAAILTLTGPKSADNVDPWRLVSDSFTWR